MNKKQKGRYRKTSPGEKLTYRDGRLKQYSGQQFCLRITLDDMDLDSCFFVYLNEPHESSSIRQLLNDCFISPNDRMVAVMKGWLEPWLKIDPNLTHKYELLRKMFAKSAKGGVVRYYINHGPKEFSLGDKVASHLSTSIFEDNSFNDKLLDLVIEFRTDQKMIPSERSKWRNFGLIHGTPKSREQISHKPARHAQSNQWRRANENRVQNNEPDRRDAIIIPILLILGIPAVICCIVQWVNNENKERYRSSSSSNSSSSNSSSGGAFFYGGGL